MKKKFILFSLTSVFIMLAIVIFINLISLYIFSRIDFTEGAIYSLSEASKKLARTLPDRILIKAYFTKNLPLQYDNTRKYLEDLLTEYSIYSRGKIKYKFVDPSTSRDIFNEVRSLNIPSMRFTQIEKDKYEVKEGYMGLSFVYGDRNQVIPVVKGRLGLEYDISSKIKRVITTQGIDLGSITGHGETIIPSQINQFLFSSKYSIRPINLSEDDIDDKFAAIYVLNPKREFTDKELSVIEQYILRGKPIAFLIDMFDINMQNFMARKLNLGLDNFFAHYGIKILPGLVLDWQCNRIGVKSQQEFYTVENVVEFPFFPIATTLSKDNSIVKDRDSLPLVFVSPIEITPRDNLDIEILAKSSPKSWYIDKVFNVNPFGEFVPRKDDRRGPFNLAVVINPKPGEKYKNYFTNISTCVTKPIHESTKLGRIFIISTSKFLDSDAELFMNIVNWISEDEELISIRSKGSQLRLLKTVPYGIRLLYKYINIFLVPLLIVLYGLFRWRYRHFVRKGYIKTYG